jgi:hypothetical protein
MRFGKMSGDARMKKSCIFLLNFLKKLYLSVCN